jgi:ADP-ribose pyrophosphatase YjhB (NUDIX family)
MEKEEINEMDKIFQKLMHFPNSTFSDLFDKSIPSNKFTYYLKKMESDGLIEKNEGKYSLTLNGRMSAATIDGETGKNKKRPFVAMLLAIKKGDDYILYTRMKEPYYGNKGFPGAKVEMGEEILLAAKRELFEETGLTCEGKIVTVQNLIDKNNDEIFNHIIQYVILFENPKGELIKENREGTYEWMNKDKIKKLKNLFPDVPYVIDDIENNKFSIREIKIIQKNEKFVGAKIEDIVKYKF